MPYVDKMARKKVDDSIEQLVNSLFDSINSPSLLIKDGEDRIVPSPQDLLKACGNLNYSITRTCSLLMGTPSYSKIALITGVLENVKQEFYRRVAVPYEDLKIMENGDVEEYTKVKPVVKS